MDDWLQQYLNYYSDAYGEGQGINPYQTSYGGDFSVYSDQASGEFAEMAGIDPGSLQAYGYQGLNPDIMGALMNVLDVGDLTHMPAWSYGAGLGGSDEAVDTDIIALQPGVTSDNVSDAIYGATGDLWTLLGGEDRPFAEENPFYSMESLLGLTDVFDPESLARTLTTLAEVDLDTPIRAAEVKALSPEAIKKTESAYYEPYEETQRESLVEKVGQARGKVQTGGFAGSGGRQAGLSGAERLYRGGYEDILSSIMKMRGQATTDVMDTIYGWQELISGE